MKLKLLIVVFSILIISGMALAVEMRTFYMDNVDGATGKVEIRNTPSLRNGWHKAYVNVWVNDLHIEPDKILEGWLVDEDTGYKLSTGAIQPNTRGRAMQKFHQLMVNFEIYDKYVLTIEPINDTDPNPSGVVALETAIV